LDLSVTLKVNKEQVPKFIFEMGAERLDAYLSFQVEESIRGLVYDVTHDRVNDMRGEFAEDMLAVLQTKVERFGVDIKAVKITNVALPNILQERRHPRRNQTARHAVGATPSQWLIAHRSREYDVLQDAADDAK
jgi:regulator of protease activity HflC (stomatin/prohibitin superfamily)